MRRLEVAAVPLTLEPASHPEAARERLLAAVMAAVNGAGRRSRAHPGAGSAGEGAAGGRPRLVALPALAGLLALASLSGEAVRWDRSLRELVWRQGMAAAELWCEWASQVARSLGIYLCAGSVLWPVREGFQHVGLAFGPDGRLLARQPQLHVSPAEAQLGLVPGGQWAPFQVDGWAAALAVGQDGWVPEVARWASLDGVRLVVHPAYHFGPANPWAAIAGPWQLVQQTQTFWVHITPAGALDGRPMAPRAAVFAPCEITPKGRGWLADDSHGRPVQATLDGEALEHIRRRYPLEQHLNPRLYLEGLLPAYRRSQGGPPAPAGQASTPPAGEEPAFTGEWPAPADEEPAPRGERPALAGREPGPKPAGQRKRGRRRPGPRTAPPARPGDSPPPPSPPPVPPTAGSHSSRPGSPQQGTSLGGHGGQALEPRPPETSSSQEGASPSRSQPPREGDNP